LILIIDNYDSFTYNLVQLVGSFTSDLCVVRNDKTTVEEIGRTNPSGVVISPGPGRPEKAGICVEVVRQLGHRIPILGVCLGHQAIGYAFGARIVHAPTLMHGKTSHIRHEQSPLFREIPSPFEATRYHSLIVDRPSLPAALRVTASSDEGVIMGIEHERYPVQGIQFHPESVLTKAGPKLLENWIGPVLGKRGIA
jgi:anthranilate synthase component 2